MDKKYLPSRTFVVGVAFILIILVTIFGVSKLIKYLKNKNVFNRAPTKVLVRDLIQKDSNNNGIADWEEALWGLDPEKDGKSNKEIIELRKKELAERNNPLSEEEKALEENDILSREFFAVIMSLFESGNLSEETITEVSNIVGERIRLEPIPDKYTKEMLVIKGGEDADLLYFQAFQKLLDKYADADIGGELIIVAQAIAANNPQAISTVGSIAASYSSFAKELIKIPVPLNISTGHLKLANDYEKTGQSIEGLMQILNNPMVGMKALLNYKKYSEEILSDLIIISGNL